MGKRGQSQSEMLKGTLDMMILRTLVGGDAYGHTIAKVIERTSEDLLEVEQGSLYPALHRLEDRRWVSSYWGASENNRKAKFYRLTAMGRKQLVRETSRWRQMTDRKSTRLNSSHLGISYAVFCLMRSPPRSPFFPYTTLFRSNNRKAKFYRLTAMGRKQLVRETSRWRQM